MQLITSGIPLRKRQEFISSSRMARWYGSFIFNFTLVLSLDAMVYKFQSEPKAKTALVSIEKQQTAKLREKNMVNCYAQIPHVEVLGMNQE